MFLSCPNVARQIEILLIAYERAGVTYLESCPRRSSEINTYVSELGTTPVVRQE
jgi:hypothetical protein